jgi:hypothetical protein
VGGVWEAHAARSQAPRPAADDNLPLAMMAQMIVREGLTELAAAKKVAARMTKLSYPTRQHSYEATVERLRKKFAGRRPQLVRGEATRAALELVIEQGTSLGLAVGKSRPRKTQ